jgi:hypothetical protein
MCISNQATSKTKLPEYPFTTSRSPCFKAGAATFLLFVLHSLRSIIAGRLISAELSFACLRNWVLSDMLIPIFWLSLASFSNLGGHFIMGV